LSSYTNEPYLPLDEYFEEVASREVESTYYWSQKFRHFILFEGVEIVNNEEIAILEVLYDSPFGLISDFNENKQRYLVKYQNGDIKIAEKSIIRIQNAGISIK